MTKRARARVEKAPSLVFDPGPIPHENLEACARVIARIAVEQALSDLKVDFQASARITDDTHLNSGPVGVTSTDGAQERVL